MEVIECKLSLEGGIGRIGIGEGCMYRRRACQIKRTLKGGEA